MEIKEITIATSQGVRIYTKGIDFENVYVRQISEIPQYQYSLLNKDGQEVIWIHENVPVVVEYSDMQKATE